MSKSPCEPLGLDGDACPDPSTVASLCCKSATPLPAAPAPTERDEFELWYAPLFAGGHVANMPRRGNGEYVHPQAQIAWLSYSAALAARQAPTSVPRIDYDLLKLTLDQTQERLRQAEEAIAKRDATALRVAQYAGELARDAAPLPRQAAVQGAPDQAKSAPATTDKDAP